jgi:hypothetical protein
MIAVIPDATESDFLQNFGFLKNQLIFNKMLTGKAARV